jgi:dCMP deaminase
MNKFIALVGMCGAGKSEVADILQEKGLGYFRFGQIVLDIVKEKGLEVNEKNERSIREGVRKEHGMAAMAILNQPKIDGLLEKGDVVGDGLYSWDEYKVLKDKYQDNLYVVHVYSPPQIRYERLEGRTLKASDKSARFRPMTAEQAHTRDYSEIENLAKGGPIAMADHVLMNTGNLKDLRSGVEDILEQIDAVKYKKKRPSWDDYFVRIMLDVGERATCDRGKSGCVIVKNKHILSTGYVGAPNGAPHCDDVGHLMKKVINDDGSISQHCMRTTHAEQNAIAQAAKMGLSIDGATLYCKMEPCAVCAKMIINSGIKRVVAQKRYHRAQESRELFRLSGVRLDVIDDEIQTYKNM